MRHPYRTGPRPPRAPRPHAAAWLVPLAVATLAWAAVLGALGLDALAAAQAVPGTALLLGAAVDARRAR